MSNLKIISLEPRLQEYVNKKKQYKINKVQPSVPLEKEFNITREDMHIINNYMKGFEISNKNFDILNLSASNDTNKFSDLKSAYLDNNTIKENRNLLKEDPRLLRMKEKIEKDKRNVQKRDNYEHFDFTPTLNIPENVNYDTQKQDRFLELDYDLTKHHTQNYERTNMRKYNNPPQIQYNTFNPYGLTEQQFPFEQKDNLNINKVKVYTDKIDNTYQFESELDTDHKVVIPAMYYKNKRYNSRENCDNPNEIKMRDINFDDYLRNSNPTRKTKSLGYRNPVEHYFNYISEDIQDPRHIVLDFPRGGEVTRQYNKQNAKKYTREIY